MQYLVLTFLSVSLWNSVYFHVYNFAYAFVFKKMWHCTPDIFSSLLSLGEKDKIGTHKTVCWDDFQKSVSLIGFLVTSLTDFGLVSLNQLEQKLSSQIMIDAVM